MKSTPGPWEISNSRRQIGKRALNGSLNLLADTTNSCFYEDDEANARLIAAAPTMDTAIRSMIVNINLALINSDNAYLRLAIKAGEQALAKAEGK